MDNWADIYAYYTFNHIEPPVNKKFIHVCDSPDDIRIYTSPWVANANIIKTLGVLSLTLEGDYSIDEGLEKVEYECKQNAFYMGANAITNFTCDIYLWDTPRTFRAGGARCILQFSS